MNNSKSILSIKSISSTVIAAALLLSVQLLGQQPADSRAARIEPGFGAPLKQPKITVASVAATAVLSQRIYIESSGTDALGQQLVFALKEAVRRSSGYHLADSPKDSINVELITLDPGEGTANRNDLTSVSLLVTIDVGLACQASSVVIYHSAYIAGAKKINSVAATILAELDKRIGELRTLAATQ